MGRIIFGRSLPDGPLTTKHVAELLGISPRDVMEWYRLGLAWFTVGTCTRITSAQQIERYAEERGFSW